METLKRLVAKPYYRGAFVFKVSVSMGESTVILNKPIYLGQAILDLSKTLMYDFHYGYVKPKYGDRARLLFTDTDSVTGSRRRTFTRIYRRTLPNGSTPVTTRRDSPLEGLMSNTGNLSPMENPIGQVLRWIRWSFFPYRSRDKHTYRLHDVINASTITI